MSFFFRSGEIKAVLFRPVNDGRQRDFLVVGIFQTVFDIAVVIGRERDFFVLDNGFFDRKFFENIPFGLRIDSRRTLPLILDGEIFRIFFILLDEGEEPSFLDSQDLLDVFSFNRFFQIPFQKFLNLNRGESLVQLGHILSPFVFSFRLYDLQSGKNAFGLRPPI